MFSKIGKIGDRKATLTPPRQFGLPEGETLSLEEERSVVSRAIKVFDDQEGSGLTGGGKDQISVLRSVLAKTRGCC